MRIYYLDFSSNAYQCIKYGINENINNFILHKYFNLCQMQKIFT